MILETRERIERADPIQSKEYTLNYSKEY